MKRSADYGAPRGRAELAAYTEHFAQSFGVSPEHAGPWMKRAQRERIRLLRRGGEVVAGLVLIRMGQWFGGRAVPMAGIAAVCVPPEHRATGAGSALMRATLDELAKERMALSTLYPATLPVYRRVGYEQAGTWLLYRLPIKSLDSRERKPGLRRATARDRAGIRALYDEVAARRQGVLDRGEYIWTRVFDAKAHSYVVEERGRIAAYGVYLQKPNDRRHYDLHCTDVLAATPEAGRRLLAFLASHRSLADDVVWAGGPSEPLLLLPAEYEAKVERLVRWMTRIVDVERALTARGYAPNVRLDAHLDVRDELIPSNGGRWVLSVSEGRARVRRGGTGRIAMDVRGLAALFTGYLSPFELRASGLMSGPDDALQELGAVFAGPAPHLVDFF